MSRKLVWLAERAANRLGVGRDSGEDDNGEREGRRERGKMGREIITKKHG